MNIIAKITCYFERTEIVQAIFKYSDIQYTALALDKILNSLIYKTLFYVWPTLYITNVAALYNKLVFQGM